MLLRERHALLRMLVQAQIAGHLCGIEPITWSVAMTDSNGLRRCVLSILEPWEGDHQPNALKARFISKRSCHRMAPSATKQTHTCNNPDSRLSFPKGLPPLCMFWMWATLLRIEKCCYGRCLSNKDVFVQFSGK